MRSAILYRGPVILLFVLTASCTFAQVTTGRQPLGSYGGGPADSVNLANLNVHLDVPIFSRAGRGMNFSYSLGYDSSVWTPSSAGTWLPANGWGWTAETQTETGYVTAATNQWKCYSGSTWYWATTYGRWTYYDKVGTPHPFSGPWISSCPSYSYHVENATSSDGSGYQITAYPGSAVIYDAGGHTINPPFATGTGPGTAEDTNGNEITFNGTTFTDTLGTTALTVSGTSPMVFSYTPPAGGTASYTVSYISRTVKTNFGCGTIGEFGPTSVPLVDRITLPDSTYYQFEYEPTPGYSGDYTGRIYSVTLPTGGTITYAYSGGSNGITCADGSTATLTRTTPDGTWKYAHSESGTAWTTNITDPQSNQTTLNFQDYIANTQNYFARSEYETERQVSQGSSTLLKTILTCYNGNTSNCNSTAVTTPITQKTVFIQWPGSNNLESRSDTHYNSYGLPTELDEYDYGNGSPGALQRKTITAYASLGNDIQNRPQTVTVEDGSSNVKAQTTLCYDEGTPSGTTTCAATGAPTPTSGTPQHLSITGSRGNVTTIASLVSGSTTLGQTFTYWDTGNANVATDVNGAQTTPTYGACGNSFPTSVAEPLGLSISITWNCTGGVETSVKDENLQTVSTNYTNAYFWRPDSATDQLSNTTDLHYSGQTSVESSLNFNGSTSTTDILNTVDGLGRGHLKQIKESQTSSTYDSSEIDYDITGRPYRTTLPYATTSGQTCSTSCAYTTTVYDALGRPKSITDAGNGTNGYTYTQNDVYQTLGPAPPGENTKQKQMEYDALGRLSSVCEVTSATGSGTCGQNTAKTGLWTEYSYNVNNNLTGVTQNAQSSGAQTRIYAYDDLGRMTSETNPENATTTYTYDTDATCGTSNGDLVKKTDAAGDTICFTYDAFHRMTSTTYSGTYASVTPSRHFVYDSATVNGVPMGIVKSRLAEAYTCYSPCSAKITDEGFSYSARGESSDIYESTPNSGGYYHSSATFWANGALNVLTDSLGYSLTYGVDPEGRIFSTTDSGGSHPLASTSYNTASQPTQLIFGYSGDSDGYLYDPNTGRMIVYGFYVGTQNQFSGGILTWNANGSLQNLNTQDLFNTAGTQSCNYLDDDLSRIGSVNCTGNQLQNSGFESGNVDWALGSPWSIVNNAANAQSGSWYLSGSSTGETPAVASVSGSTFMPVSPGETITFGGFIKRIGGTGVLDYGCLIFDAHYNLLGGCPGGAGLGDGSGGTSWQLYSAQTTLPSNAAYIEFYAELHGFGDTDTSLTTGYFDSVFMDGVPVWAQTFGYDPFGNINKTGNSSFNPSYSSTTNRMMQIGSSTPTYDANGNVTNDFLHTYAWDANGRPVTVDGVGVTYDALGRMVEQNRSGAHTQKIYSPTGFQMQIVNGQTSVYSFSPMPGGGATVWSAPAGTIYYRHADWLGSSRFASTYTRTVFYDGAYAPFGEQYANSGTSDLSFTGMDSDTSSNLYDFPAREYGIQGRWPSPDPAGLASVNPGDPQSWNRYAYVRNSPAEIVDPSGMMMKQGANGGGGGGYGIGVGGDYGVPDFGGNWWDDGSVGFPGDIWGDYGLGTDQSGIWGESAPGGFQPFPSIFSGGANPGGSGCSNGNCGGITNGYQDPSVITDNPCVQNPEMCVIQVIVWGTAIYESIKMATSQAAHDAYNAVKSYVNRLHTSDQSSGRQAKCYPVHYNPQLQGCNYYCEDGTRWFETGSCKGLTFKPWGDGFPAGPPVPTAPR